MLTEFVGWFPLNRVSNHVEDVLNIQCVIYFAETILKILERLGIFEILSNTLMLHFYLLKKKILAVI